jgi:hypothetical protein
MKIERGPMKKSIRRTAVGLSVVYSDGAFSNNLTGREIELDDLSGCLCLHVDLTPNIHIRNKQANCYHDACELAERNMSLKSLQIDDKQVFEKLAVAARNLSGARWRLELALGEKGTFKYAAKPRGSAGSVIFDGLTLVAGSEIRK